MKNVKIASVLQNYLQIICKYQNFFVPLYAKQEICLICLICEPKRIIEVNSKHNNKEYGKLRSSY